MMFTICIFETHNCIILHAICNLTELLRNFSSGPKFISAKFRQNLQSDSGKEAIGWSSFVIPCKTETPLLNPGGRG